MTDHPIGEGHTLLFDTMMLLVTIVNFPLVPHRPASLEQLAIDEAYDVLIVATLLMDVGGKLGDQMVPPGQVSEYMSKVGVDMECDSEENVTEVHWGTPKGLH